MNNTKTVIEIVKKASNHFEYDAHYYFTEIAVVEGKTKILFTGNIWEATRFNEMTEIEMDSWHKFIKSFFGKHYIINFKTISLIYELT